MVFSFTLHELRDELRALGHEDLSNDVIMEYLSQLNLPNPDHTSDSENNLNPNPNSHTTSKINSNTKHSYNQDSNHRTKPITEPEPNHRSKPKQYEPESDHRPKTNHLLPEPIYRSKPKHEAERNPNPEPNHRIDAKHNPRSESNFKSNPKCEPELKSVEPNYYKSNPNPKTEPKHGSKPSSRTSQQSLSDYNSGTDVSFPTAQACELALPMPPPSVRTSPPITSSDSYTNSDTESSPTSSDSDESYRGSHNSVTQCLYSGIASPERAPDGKGNLRQRPTVSSSVHVKANPMVLSQASLRPVQEDYTGKHDSSSNIDKRSVHDECSHPEELGLYSRFLSDNDDYEEEYYDEESMSDDRFYPVENAIAMQVPVANLNNTYIDTLADQENPNYTDNMVAQGNPCYLDTNLSIENPNPTDQINPNYADRNAVQENPNDKSDNTLSEGNPNYRNKNAALENLNYRDNTAAQEIPNYRGKNAGQAFHFYSDRNPGHEHSNLRDSYASQVNPSYTDRIEAQENPNFTDKSLGQEDKSYMDKNAAQRNPSYTVQNVAQENPNYTDKNVGKPEDKIYTDKTIENYWRSVGDDHIKSLHDRAPSECGSIKSDETLSVASMRNSSVRASRTGSLIDKVQNCQDELKKLSMSLKSQQKSRKPWFLEEMKRANKVHEVHVPAPPPPQRVTIASLDGEEDEEDENIAEDEDEQIEEDNEEDYDVEEENELDVKEDVLQQEEDEEIHVSVSSKLSIKAVNSSVATKQGGSTQFQNLHKSVSAFSVAATTAADEGVSKLHNDFNSQTFRSQSWSPTTVPSPSPDTVINGLFSAPSSSAPSPEPAEVSDFSSQTSSSLQSSRVPTPTPELHKIIVDKSSPSSSSVLSSSSAPSPSPHQQLLNNNLSTTDTSSSSSSSTSSKCTSFQAGDDININPVAEDIPILFDAHPIPHAPCCSPSSSISAKSLKAKQEEELEEEEEDCDLDDDDQAARLSPWFKESNKPSVVEKQFEAVSKTKTKSITVLDPPKDVTKTHSTKTAELPLPTKPFSTPPRNVKPPWDDTLAGYPIYKTKDQCSVHLRSPSTGSQLPNKKQYANSIENQAKLKNDKSVDQAKRNVGATTYDVFPGRGDYQYCSKSPTGSYHDSISSGASTQLSKSSKKQSRFVGQPLQKRGGKIDRVARYAEMQKLWRKDSFLMANDQGGKRKASQKFANFFCSSIQTQ